jgi:uncharacterized protein
MSFAPIDVHDLHGHPGTSLTLEAVGTLEGLRGELAELPDAEPVHAGLLLEAVVEGILVSGEARGRWVLRCARCLTTFDGAYEAPLSELVVLAPGGDDDEYTFDPAVGLDPEPIVRDAIGIQLPFSPLCSPGCLGLCETCGGDRNRGECPGHGLVDPRFAALSELIVDPDES